MFKYIVYDKNGNVIGYTNKKTGSKIYVTHNDKEFIVDISDIGEFKSLDFFALNKIMRERNGEL